MIIPIISFSATSFASVESNSVNEYDSMHRYNALENKISFFNITNNTDNSEEKLLESKIVIYDDTEKLQDITKQQNSSMEKSENAISAIEDRNGIITFLIGNKLGTLKFQMVQMKDQSYTLNMLALNTKDNTTKSQINSQIDVSEQQQIKVENFIVLQEDKFNLFGWLVASL